MAPFGKAPRAGQHHPPAAAAEMSRTQSGRESQAVPERELALQPDLPIPGRHPRSLLSCLEPAHRAALDYHVNRPARVGPWVLIKATWYYTSLSGTLLGSARIGSAHPSARPGEKAGDARGL